MASEKLMELNSENFETEVIQSQVPVLVDFWASWCGPCRAVAPVMEELAVEFEGKIKVGKINVDDQGELAAKYRIMSIPTVMLFKGGSMAEKIIGARSKEEFSKMISNNL